MIKELNITPDGRIYEISQKDLPVVKGLKNTPLLTEIIAIVSSIGIHAYDIVISTYAVSSPTSAEGILRLINSENSKVKKVPVTLYLQPPSTNVSLEVLPSGIEITRVYTLSGYAEINASLSESYGISTGEVIPVKILSCNNYSLDRILGNFN